MPGHTGFLGHLLLFSQVGEGFRVETLGQSVLSDLDYGWRTPKQVVELLDLLVASDVLLEVVCTQLR
jgi:hypothetical protein